MAGRHTATTRPPVAMTPRRLAALSAVSSRALVLLLALVTLLTTTYLTAVSAAQSGAFDAAVGETFDQGPPGQRDIGLTLRLNQEFTVSRRDLPPTDGPGAPFAAINDAMLAAMPQRLRAVIETPTWAAATPAIEATSGIQGREGTQTQMVVRAQSGLTERVTWVKGGAPTGPSREHTITTASPVLGEPATVHRVALIPVAVYDLTAQAWGLSVGDVVELTPSQDQSLDAMAVVVSGIFTARQPADGYWSADPRMLGIAKVNTAQGGIADLGTVLAAPEAYGEISDSLRREPLDPSGPLGSSVLDHSWRYPIVSSRLTQADLPMLRAFPGELQAKANVWGSSTLHPRLVTGIPSLLRQYDHVSGVTKVLLSFAVAGVAALAAVVLVVGALILIDRRRQEMHLLTSRGAGKRLMWAIVARWLVEWTVPAALVGVVIAWLIAGRVWWPGLAVAAVFVGLPVGAALAQLSRGVLRPLQRSTSTMRWVARLRRVGCELAFIVVAVAAMWSIRARGASITSGRTDWLLALTPLLVALGVGVIAMRLLPFPLRAIARSGRRARGLIAFLGVTRAARTSGAHALPILGLILASTLLALLGSVAGNISEQRVLAAYERTGASARIDYARLDPGDVLTLRRQEGVSDVVSAFVENNVPLTLGGRRETVQVIAVDPQAYAALLAATPAAFRVPRTDPTQSALPLLVSASNLAGASELLLRGERLPARSTAVEPSLRRIHIDRMQPVVIVPYADLVKAVPTVQPNTAFASVTPAAARKIQAMAIDPKHPLGRLVTNATTVDGLESSLTERAVNRLVTGAYLCGLIVSIGLSLLASFLLLLATREERVQALTRLRTMGLPHGSGWRLGAVEVLPVVALTALVGSAIGVLAPCILAPALDLAPLVGGVAHPPVSARPGVVIMSAVAVIVVAVVSLVADEMVARRHALGDHLRKGVSP